MLVCVRIILAVCVCVGLLVYLYVRVLCAFVRQCVHLYVTGNAGELKSLIILKLDQNRLVQLTQSIGK